MIGSLTKCTEKEYLSGRMGDNTLENIMMIKRKESENFFGLMEENLMDSGLMVNKKVWVFIIIKMEI